MAEEVPGYDKVAKALAQGATAFWKTVFDDLAKGEKSDTLMSLAGEKAMASISTDDIKEFFAILGGAKMDIDIIPKITKGTKTFFDSGDVLPGSGILQKDDANGVSTLGVEGSISIGIGIKF
ncbi:MAG TPA: hypothetical protein VGB77_10570 [Abditibacteriaceae bacterium]